MNYRSIIKRVVSVCFALSLAFVLGIGPSVLDQPALAAAGPDLVVPDISMSPSNPAMDDTVTITVTVKNQGTALAYSSQVVCYVDDAILATNSIVSLDAGALVTTAFTWQAEAGAHIIRAVADSAGSVSESDESNNTMNFSMTTLAPDLIVQSISWTPAGPSKGDSIVFRVTVKNQGNSRSRTTRLNFYIDGISRGYKDVYPIDPGNTAASDYSWVAQSGQHAVKAVIDESDTVEEGNEANNEYNLTFSTLPPDLVVKQVTWDPPTPSKNDIVTFTANVTNQGSGRSDACQLAYYIDGEYRSTLLVEALDAGSSSNITFTWTAQSELHEIKVIVDFTNMVTEIDENNNEYIASFLTLLPDLTIRDITWEPEDAGVGDDVTFTAIVENQGTGRAEPSRINCYITGSYSGYVDIGEIEAGENTTAVFEWTAAGGTYTVKIVADNDYRVIESKEDNNTTVRTIAIIPPDIFIPVISWSPENPPIGDTVTFTANITNLGGGTAGGFSIAYYLDDVLLSYEFVSGIVSGDNVFTTCTWKAQNGRHTFKAVADYNKMVSESNEHNNENAVTVTPLMPDIAVGTVTWSPADMPVGSKVTFAIPIENQGTLSAGASRVVYYIDDVIAGYNDIDRLEAGASVTEYFPWTVAAGSHAIAIVADSNDQVFELDENNTKVVTIPLADLIVTDIAWSPPEASIGDNVTFTATVRNTGAGLSRDARAACYIDGVLLDTREFPEIAPGDSASASFVWAAAGCDHSVAVLADFGNAITEVDETNNDKEAAFATLTPDLVVEDIEWYMENPLASDAVDINMVIRNQGTDITGDFRLCYSIDNDQAVSEDIAPLPAGASFIVSVTPLLEMGPHTFSVSLDIDEQVIELDEDNNDESVTFTTVAPDLVIRSISWSPRAAAGENIMITVNVGNQGSVKAEKSRIDLYINGSPLSYIEIDELGVGAVLSHDFSWSAVAGPQEISAYADIGELLLESNEINNSKSRTISLAETVTPTKPPVVDLSPISSEDKGFIGNYWWVFMLAAALLGGGAFALAFKSFKKE